MMPVMLEDGHLVVDGWGGGSGASGAIHICPPKENTVWPDNHPQFHLMSCIAVYPL